MADKKFTCPRCGSDKIIDYEVSFDCPLCKKEFDKSDFDLIDDPADILSVKEKSDISDALFEDTDKE